ncbi:hypothetical protein [Commensalibacter nepenthis]|uniref:Secreted protein n=1 Tax=Commensalibacter nepenthis TaxID=3043872 RepID=A0ABT6Q7L2_9PROT|nr:hypothetical protein [Commensalibacter sp. TBRC 10068]MDI2112876.1 hypothetical protein [Commensalibacter sp. TBRC 10068]
MPSNHIAFLTLLGICFSSVLGSYSAHANYKRCWIKDGVATINCNPADGYYFVKEKELYKKCTVANGQLKKECKEEDGFAMFLENHHWYQCPIQNGKKIDSCTLATGYYTIFLPHLPLL